MRNDSISRRFRNDESEERRKRKIEEADRSILDGIPIVGRPLAWVKERFGWQGVLLILAGFLVAIILAYADLLPKWLIPNQGNVQPLPATHELLANPKTVLAQAMRDAKTDMELSGVALTFIEFNVLEQKIRGGFVANIVLLDPCEGGILERIVAENGNENPRTNLRTQLKKLQDLRRRLPPNVQHLLKVKLSPHPATMIVGMFDRRRDLYMYPCPFGQPCTESPVLVFRDNRERNPQNSAVFEAHYLKLFNDRESVDLDTYNLDKPCLPPNPDRANRR